MDVFRGTRRPARASTINREVSCLVAALNLASAEGLFEGAPKVKKERETPRERTLSDAEYRAILDASPRWLQRVIIAANEAALDQGVLLKLSWDCVRDGLIVVKAAIPRILWPIPTSPTSNGRPASAHRV